MYKIDAHQHFWQYNPVRDSWITDDMHAIQRDFLPADLLQLLLHNHIHGCIAVQSDQSEADNEFLLKQAQENPFIKGIVGWVDLQAPNVEDRLRYYRQYKKIKGFRHVLQGEPQRDMMLNDAFKHGINLLNKYGFTYDLLILCDQLSYTEKLVSQFPDQAFIIDHLAKPDIRNHQLDGWQEGMKALASYPNVNCKVSGMVTEADWHHWKEADFTPYLDVVFEAFGPNRVMFGSDWPVCMVAGGYNQMIKMVKNYVKKLSAHEQALFWGDNAVKIYQLEV
ncbi:amidohydrolase family protein [Mucilaginibacter robiniae]|uniref:Amidohydrolase family protein n=1 Tax=Mucilaginibacter robiniae TaxID=2728022 RepID=A0A7L5E8R8_9SPHI|nr:amidohydrolase family protein [Mucilaginibacter robiniae]QJD97273.1 amidohydrolase family protein [Mucilaginibacter robiniae]